MKHVCIYILGGFFSLLLLGGASGVSAAEPDFLVSWKANNYVPESFLGKSFPIYQTPVTISFELISRNVADAGKIFDISDRDVRWYVNSRLIGKGNGLKTFTIKNSFFEGGKMNVKISVAFFDAEAKKGSQEYFANTYLTIPVVSPKIVIQHASFQRLVSAGSMLDVRALPLFFNGAVNSLNVAWDVSGQKPQQTSQNPFELRISLPSPLPLDSLRVLATIGGMTDSRNRASGSLLFDVQ